MKTFSEELERIEIKFVDKDGNELIKKGKYLTIKDLKQLDKFREGEGKGNFDVLCDQVSYIFGGKPNDYTKYSFPLLSKVMNYVKEVYIVNPPNQVKEN